MSACFPTRIKDIYCHFPQVIMLHISIRAMLIDISVYSLAIRRPYGKVDNVSRCKVDTYGT